MYMRTLATNENEQKLIQSHGKNLKNTKPKVRNQTQIQVCISC